MPGAACSSANPGTGNQEFQGPYNWASCPAFLALRPAAKDRRGRSQRRAANRTAEPHWESVQKKGWWVRSRSSHCRPAGYLRCRSRQDCSLATGPASWRNLGKAGHRSPWGLGLVDPSQAMVRTPRARRPRRTSVWKFSPDLSPEPMLPVGDGAQRIGACDGPSRPKGASIAGTCARVKSGSQD